MRNSIRTKTGQLMGTPAYMSPEQCRGSATLDRRADVYSLGCIIFEMLTGRPPFDHESMGEIIAAHLYGPPPMLRDVEPSVPLWLEAVVAKALSKKPEDRQQTMEQLASQLADAKRVSIPPIGDTAVMRFPGTTPATPAPTRPRRRHGLAWALGGGLLLAAAAIGLLRLQREPSARAAAAATPPRAAGPEVVKAVVPMPVAIAAPAPPPAPVAETVTLKITSSPPGADVYRALDGIKLGKTPLEQTLRRSSGLAVFVLKLRGHRDARVELPAAGDGEASVVLQKRSRKGRAKSPDGALDPFAR
jgi:serine/threonine-protein kinase